MLSGLRRAFSAGRSAWVQRCRAPSFVTWPLAVAHTEADLEATRASTHTVVAYTRAAAHRARQRLAVLRGRSQGRLRRPRCRAPTACVDRLGVAGVDRRAKPACAGVAGRRQRRRGPSSLTDTTESTPSGRHHLHSISGRATKAVRLRLTTTRRGWMRLQNWGTSRKSLAINSSLPFLWVLMCWFPRL